MSPPIRTRPSEPPAVSEAMPALGIVMIAAVVMALSLVVSTIGCSDSQGPAPTPEPPVTYRSDLPRDLAPAATDADLAILAQGDREFALDLYRRLDASTSEPNLLLSPWSIRIAFAMAWAGARGETAAQMSEALRYGLPAERLHPAYDALDLALAGRNLPAAGDSLDAVEVAPACSFWGQVDFPFVDAYLDLLAVNYGAGIWALDFRAAPDPARLTINDWVAGKTHDRIVDLLPPRSLDADTRAVLVSALYLKAPWDDPFDPEETATGAFHRLDGRTVDVPLMHRMLAGNYWEEPGAQALELPLRGQELSMVFLLPAAGRFGEFTAQLTATRLQEILAHLAPAEAQVTLPRFSFRSAFSLSDQLKAMGMTLAFTGAADFSGICEAERLTISEAYHQAFIAVQERGVEAAAATAVVFAVTVVPDPATFTADRPFLFLIRDTRTGALLFFGRVEDPS